VSFYKPAAINDFSGSSGCLPVDGDERQRGGECGEQNLDWRERR
jgi:hypothetical protein